MEKSKVYISGPITGKEDLNVAAFERAEESLKRFYTINPHKIVDAVFSQYDVTFTALGTRKQELEEQELHQACMLICLRALLGREPGEECDVIYMLKGWELSEGARMEKAVAECCGIAVWYEQTPKDMQ